jgi:hypothetical protein
MAGVAADRRSSHLGASDSLAMNLPQASDSLAPLGARGMLRKLAGAVRADAVASTMRFNAKAQRRKDAKDRLHFFSILCAFASLRLCASAVKSIVRIVSAPFPHPGPLPIGWGEGAIPEAPWLSNGRMARAAILHLLSSILGGCGFAVLRLCVEKIRTEPVGWNFFGFWILKFGVSLHIGARSIGPRWAAAARGDARPTSHPLSSVFHPRRSPAAPPRLRASAVQ